MHNDERYPAIDVGSMLKIIDQEKVRAGDRTIDAVAIYEVENGKIRRVTFVQ